MMFMISQSAEETVSITTEHGNVSEPAQYFLVITCGLFF